MTTPASPHRIRLPAPWQIQRVDDEENSSTEQNAQTGDQTQAQAPVRWDCERSFNLPSGLNAQSQLSFEVRLNDVALRLIECAVNGQVLSKNHLSSELPHLYRFDCPLTCLIGRNAVRLRVGSAHLSELTSVAIELQTMADCLQVALVIAER